eukprot:10547548-Alexandrium_andersonii.AAC.1
MCIRDSAHAHTHTRCGVTKHARAVSHSRSAAVRSLARCSRARARGHLFRRGGQFRSERTGAHGAR